MTSLAKCKRFLKNLPRSQVLRLGLAHVQMFSRGCLLARACHCSLISFAFDCIQGIITLLHHAIVISHWIFTTLKDWLLLNIKAFNLLHYSFHMLNNFRQLFFVIRLLQLCQKLDCKIYKFMRVSCMHEKDRCNGWPCLMHFNSMMKVQVTC